MSIQIDTDKILSEIHDMKPNWRTQVTVKVLDNIDEDVTLIEVDNENEYEAGTRFILSNFWTNAYITKTVSGCYRVDNVYGKAVELGADYFLIKPRY